MESTNSKSILVVEDQVLIADGIIGDLKKLGYNVEHEACRSYDEGVARLNHYQPDLVMLDIRLEGDRTGVDLAGYINENYQLPFIYLTSHLGELRTDALLGTQPAGVLTKPYLINNLQAALDLAFSRQAFSQDDPCLHYKVNGREELVWTNEIEYAEADRTYVKIYTETKEIVLRKSLNDLLVELACEDLVRVHRSYAVNRQKVKKVQSNKVSLSRQEIPISRSYRDTASRLMT